MEFIYFIAIGITAAIMLAIINAVALKQKTKYRTLPAQLIINLIETLCSLGVVILVVILLVITCENIKTHEQNNPMEIKSRD